MTREELADWIEVHGRRGLTHFNLRYGISRDDAIAQIAMIVAALRKSAPQEARGDEPVTTEPTDAMVSSQNRGAQ